MTRKCSALLVLLMAGCARGHEPTGQRVDESSPASVGVTAAQGIRELPPDVVLANDPAKLIGTWHTLPSPIEARGPDVVLKISPSLITATSGCVNFEWSYRFVGERLQMTPRPILSCQRTLTAAEAAFSETLGAATRAMHRGGRGLVFEGAKGRVVVFERPE